MKTKNNSIYAAELSRRMDACYDRHDLAGALAVAEEILELLPLNRPLLQRAASLFIDEGEKEQASRLVAFLEQNFPRSGYILFQKARVEQLNMDYGEAIQHAEEALTMQDTTVWQTALLHNILGHMYRRLGIIDKSAEHYRASGLMRGSSAGGDDELAISDYSNYLFTLHNRDCSREFLFGEIEKYNDFFSGIKQYQHAHEKRHDKIRIGYVSPDLRRHVVAFFSYAFFKSYDKRRFEVYAYAKCEEDDSSREFAAAIDKWTNIRFDSDQEAARKIYEDEIDILVDLSGHTGNNCLPILAYKPAPVQVSGIGWFNSTGLKAVDYFLADHYTDPEGLNDAYFTEKLLRLPHSHFCYMWHDSPIPVPPAPFQRKGHITFGSFNNFAKVSDEMLRVWGKILRAVPGSELFLKGQMFNSPYGTQLAISRMEKAGIPLESISAEPMLPEYLHKYSQIDIALDTYPYPGGGTTCDALYMGVPVITRVGKRHNARFGYSLLMNMGLEELCAFDEQEYIEKAVALANDPQRLIYMHQTLRRRMRQSPLMDDGMYMAELEEAYTRIWEDWLQADASDRPQKDPAALGFFYAKEYEQGKHPVDAKRAEYWLARAVETDDSRDIELGVMLSGIRQQLCDHQGAYQAIVQAEEKLKHLPPVGLSPDFLYSFYSRKASAALTAGHPLEAFSAYQEAWQNADTREKKTAMFSSLLLTAHYLDFTSQDMADLHRIYGEMFHDVCPYTEGKRHTGKIRLAYISPDFRMHVMFSFYYGLLACADKSRFEIYVYSMEEKEDAFTEQVKAQADHYTCLAGLTYEAAAARIHEDGVDVLVDLAGHSANSGLPILAYKPAPLQISGLGYLDTTGLPAVDYLITDEIVDPPGQHEAFTTEKMLYLPSQYTYVGRNDVPVSQGTPAQQRGYVVFGVFNHYRKITDEMLNVWCEILRQVPESKLLLKSQELISDSLVDAAYERLRGIGFDMDRVVFEPATLDYMERYLAVDIALDTYPYPGGGTTFDALYMGVPVITRYGERRNTRFGLSILQNAGLGDLAAASNEIYIERAVGLARDTELLDVLHQNLRKMLQNSPAGKPQVITKILEQKIMEERANG